MLFLTAALVIPGIRTFWLSFKDRRSEENVGFSNYRELWNDDLTRCVQSVVPLFNRCVVFNTIEKSYHGHPHKLSCPPEQNRKSLLLYYYRDEGHELAMSSTDYQPLPDDSLLRRLMIAADRAALRLYTFIKRRTKVSDRVMDRLLRRF